MENDLPVIENGDSEDINEKSEQIKRSFLLMKQKMLRTHELIQRYNDKIKECERFKLAFNKASKELEETKSNYNNSVSKIINLQLENKEYQKKVDALKEKITDNETKMAGDKQHVQQLICKLKEIEEKHATQSLEHNLNKSSLEMQIKEMERKLKDGKKCNDTKIAKSKKKGTCAGKDSSVSDQIAQKKSYMDVGVNTVGSSNVTVKPQVADKCLSTTKPDVVTRSTLTERTQTVDRSTLTNDFYSIKDDPYPLFCAKCEVHIKSPPLSKICQMMTKCPKLIEAVKSPPRVPCGTPVVRSAVRDSVTPPRIPPNTPNESINIFPKNAQDSIIEALKTKLAKLENKMKKHIKVEKKSKEVSCQHHCSHNCSHNCKNDSLNISSFMQMSMLWTNLMNSGNLQQKIDENVNQSLSRKFKSKKRKQLKRLSPKVNTSDSFWSVESVPKKCQRREGKRIKRTQRKQTIKRKYVVPHSDEEVMDEIDEIKVDDLNEANDSDDNSPLRKRFRNGVSPIETPRLSTDSDVIVNSTVYNVSDFKSFNETEESTHVGERTLNLETEAKSDAPNFESQNTINVRQLSDLVDFYLNSRRDLDQSNTEDNSTNNAKMKRPEKAPKNLENAAIANKTISESQDAENENNENVNSSENKTENNTDIVLQATNTSLFTCQVSTKKDVTANDSSRSLSDASEIDMKEIMSVFNTSNISDAPDISVSQNKENSSKKKRDLLDQFFGTEPENVTKSPKMPETSLSETCSSELPKDRTAEISLPLKPVEHLSEKSHSPEPAENLSERSHSLEPAENLSERSHSPEPAENGVSDTSFSSEPSENNCSEISHSPEPSENNCSEISHSPEPAENNLSEKSHSPEPVEDNFSEKSHSPEPVEDNFSDKSHSSEPVEDNFSDKSHSPEPTENGVSETPLSPAPTENNLLDRSHSPEPAENNLLERSHSPEPAENILEASLSPEPAENGVLETPLSPEPAENGVSETPLSPEPAENGVSETPLSPEPAENTILETPFSREQTENSIVVIPLSPKYPELIQASNSPEKFSIQSNDFEDFELIQNNVINDKKEQDVINDGKKECLTSLQKNLRSLKRKCSDVSPRNELDNASLCKDKSDEIQKDLDTNIEHVPRKSRRLAHKAKAVVTPNNNAIENNTNYASESADSNCTMAINEKIPDDSDKLTETDKDTEKREETSEKQSKMDSENLEDQYKFTHRVLNISHKLEALKNSQIKRAKAKINQLNMKNPDKPVVSNTVSQVSTKSSSNLIIDTTLQCKEIISEQKTRDDDKDKFQIPHVPCNRVEKNSLNTTLTGQKNLTSTNNVDEDLLTKGLIVKRFTRRDSVDNNCLPRPLLQSEETSEVDELPKNVIQNEQEIRASTSHSVPVDICNDLCNDARTISSVDINTATSSPPPCTSSEINTTKEGIDTEEIESVDLNESGECTSESVGQEKNIVKSPLTILHTYLEVEGPIRKKKRGRKRIEENPTKLAKTIFTIDHWVKKQLERLRDSNWESHIHQEIVGNLSEICSPRIIAKCVIDFIVEIPPIKEGMVWRTLDKTFTPPAPLMTKAEQKIIALLVDLEVVKPSVIEFVMCGIEYRLFHLNKPSEMRDVTSELTRIFVVLAMIKKDRERVRILCCDAIYCLGLNYIIVLYTVLTSWPAVFPREGMESNLLLKYIATLILEQQVVDFPKIEALKQLIKLYYGFPHGKYLKRDILNELITALQEKDRNGLHTAIVLLAKKEGVDWTYENVVAGALLPLIISNKHPDIYRAFFLLGNILRPFPIENKNNKEPNVITPIIEQLRDLISSSEGSPDMQEGIVSALLSLSRHDFKATITAVMDWTPQEPLRQTTVEQLEGIFRTYDINHWTVFLQKRAKRLERLEKLKNAKKAKNAKNAKNKKNKAR